MELVWNNYYAVLKDGWWTVDQYIYIKTTLWSGDEKD